jgi:hypothetical protein
MWHISDYVFPISIITWIFQNDLNHLFIDIVRSVALFVASSVVYAMLLWDHQKLVNSYYRTESWLEKVDSRLAVFYVHLQNFVKHFLPLILIGLPKTNYGIIIGYVMYNTWYILVRQRMPELYVQSITMKEYDYSVVGVSTCVLFIFLMKNLVFKSFLALKKRI